MERVKGFVVVVPTVVVTMVFLSDDHRTCRVAAFCKDFDPADVGPG